MCGEQNYRSYEKISAGESSLIQRKFAAGIRNLNSVQKTSILVVACKIQVAVDRSVQYIEQTCGFVILSSAFCKRRINSSGGRAMGRWASTRFASSLV